MKALPLFSTLKINVSWALADRGQISGGIWGCSTPIDKNMYFLQQFIGPCLLDPPSSMFGFSLGFIYHKYNNF